MARNFPIPGLARGLSARLLVLTIFFVMLSEVAIYVPSIARYRQQYLQERISTAHLATLALEATPDRMVSDELAMKLLDQVGAYGIVLSGSGLAKRAIYRRMPPRADLVVTVDDSDVVGLIMNAVGTLVQDDNRVLRVMGYSAKEGGAVIEVVIDETPMRLAMYSYSYRILALSIVIALATAALVFVSLQWMMVRPIRHLTENMVAFRTDPEDPTRMIQPSARQDEIGMAQRELAVMQRELRAALTQKARLAAIGVAVAKISHDLRNILQTASVVSDRLITVNDPEVARMAPRLVESIDRAVNLCRLTLDYAHDEPPPPRRDFFALHDLVDDVDADQALTNGSEVHFKNEVPGDIKVVADRDQIFRVLGNLIRNAAQAGAKNVRVSASARDGYVQVMVADDGPGLPARAREKLFQPFIGSVRAGGTGLGLVIAREIMRAHGGDIALLETSEKGTVFRLALPPNAAASN
ncbi:MAG TPA: HAMP domain-containing sensor histidine kinase [Alphaproteobacteria bacterium]|nr:HAMP domain-containing sensor histidine kinase [Alphaproteobacteria bacterium]